VQFDIVEIVTSHKSDTEKQEMTNDATASLPKDKAEKNTTRQFRLSQVNDERREELLQNNESGGK